MIRGTTPTITMELPEKIPVSEIREAVFTISQHGKEVITRKLADMAPDAEKNSLEVRLSQEETLKLKDDLLAMQLKLKIGEDVVASEIVTGTARQILNEEVI